MAEDYPRYPDIHDLDLTLLNPRMIVVRRLSVPRGVPGPAVGHARSRLWVILDFLLQDVTPYMNPSPFTVSPNTHVSQVFNLFRTMGLRHLPVVNAVGEVSGSGGGGREHARPAGGARVLPSMLPGLLPWLQAGCLLTPHPGSLDPLPPLRAVVALTERKGKECSGVGGKHAQGLCL